MLRKVLVFLVKIYVKCMFKIKMINYERFEKIKSGCIVAPNHISAWETVIVPALSDRVIYMMAKEELFKGKFLKWLFNKVKVFPVGRKKNDLGAVKTSIKLLKEGNAVCMFPEGTRNKGQKIEFKTGVSMIAHSAKVPVIPVGIYAEKKFKFRSKVYVVFGEPLYFTDYYDKKVNKEDMAKMTEKVRDEVIKAINSVKN